MPWPLLAILACAPEPHPAPPSRVAMFTAADPAGPWWRSPEPVARGLVSLGLAPAPGGGLRVTGLRTDRTESPLWPLVWGPVVHGLELRGGRWEERSWRVRDRGVRVALDPQWLDDELWYMASAARPGQDPVDGGLVNAIRSSPPPRERARGPGFADPSPARLDGELHLFVTTTPAAVVHLAGEPLAERGRWEGETVPHATVVDGELLVVTQRMDGGRMLPFLRRSRDGRAWSAPRPLLRPQQTTGCTSPVLGRAADPPVDWAGPWVLLCVEEDFTGAGRSPAPPPTSPAPAPRGPGAGGDAAPRAPAAPGGR